MLSWSPFPMPLPAGHESQDKRNDFDGAEFAEKAWMSTRFPADPSKEDSPRIKHATCSEGLGEQVVKPQRTMNLSRLSPQHLRAQ